MIPAVLCLNSLPYLCWKLGCVFLTLFKEDAREHLMIVIASSAVSASPPPFFFFFFFFCSGLNLFLQPSCLVWVWLVTPVSLLSVLPVYQV